ncbi:MAG: hypothetical protein VYE19_08780, partial [Chloroflexota bacterium]|nr:hypothetical protein [Chloroflexota bacterium]
LVLLSTFHANRNVIKAYQSPPPGTDESHRRSSDAWIPAFSGMMVGTSSALSFRRFPVSVL